MLGDVNNERVPVPLLNTHDNGKSCANVDMPGTVALMPFNALFESFLNVHEKLLEDVILQPFLEYLKEDFEDFKEFIVDICGLGRALFHTTQ